MTRYFIPVFIAFIVLPIFEKNAYKSFIVTCLCIIYKIHLKKCLTKRDQKNN